MIFMGIWRQIAEYLYIKKRDPNMPRNKMAEIYARHESHFCDHVCYCPYYYVDKACDNTLI